MPLPSHILGVSAWPDSPDDRRWRATFGRPPHGVWILTDEQVRESHGQLRAIPLLRALGITRFTFAHGWRGLDLVPYEWVRVAGDTRPEDLAGSFPICQIISHDIEAVSDGDAAYTLLRTRELAGPDALLVYVVDTDAFMRSRDSSGRAFWEEYDLGRPRAYAPVAHRYVSWMKAVTDAVDDPVLISQNLAWHGLASWCRVPDSLGHLEDILNPTRHRGDSPIWPLYEELCAIAGTAEADTARVRQALRGWIDVEITRSTSQVNLWLQRFAFDPELVRKRRDAHQRRAIQG